MIMIPSFNTPPRKVTMKPTNKKSLAVVISVILAGFGIINPTALPAVIEAADAIVQLVSA